MKLIALTQRVAIDPLTSERRDCLDQRWAALVAKLGGIAVALPNAPPRQVPALLDRLRAESIILTGGNSLDGLDDASRDAAPERDAFEHRLIEEAMARRIPVLGICRGMQVINRHFGGTLIRLSGHVAQDHDIVVDWPEASPTRRVNSFHNWGIARGGLAPTLVPFAHDSTGFVEAAFHPDHRVAAIMWHPERMETLGADDRLLMEAFL